MFPHGPTVTRAHTHRHTVHICTQRYIYLLTVMNFCRGSVSRPHSSRLRRSRSSTACAARAVPGSSGPRLRTGPLRKAEQPRLGGASKGRWGTPPTGGLAAKSPSGELGGTKGRIAPARGPGCGGEGPEVRGPGPPARPGPQGCLRLARAGGITHLSLKVEQGQPPNPMDF